ncbi:medium-chain acyl-CoA ligase ACSF2, mitochondrial-like [Lutzomyia longipalpis]|uniref:medium-chain acyl-CoA ligase ACSF2, mitochondrial-like n=1 Tax=Lutzomyia longipalpis TaxID=7200 RepID=UPI002483AD11|nr:medium-chain acyl-CoA ligase ACSF2, mitochondrial-like [Lutzomyia longipalpis]
MGVKKNKSVQENSDSGLSYVHSVGKNPLVYRTIGQQLKLSAQANAQREAFVFVEENKRFTYEQLLSEADRLAAGFQCLGLDKGDRVGILMPNVSAWPITMFAAARAGLISVSLNPTYTPQEIQDCLNKVSAKALVASEKFGSKIYYDQLLEILPELSSCNSKKVQSKRLPFLSTIIIDSEKDYPGTVRLRDVMSLATIHQINKIESEQGDISPDSGCNIQMTSGFTGPPKAVLLSHNCLVNNCHNVTMGISECAFIFASLPDDEDEKIIDTVGYVFSHLEAKVIDNEGKIIPFSTPGELCIRGYSTMMGYWGDEEQTRNILGSDGWLKTGDYFILEPNGYGKIIGRISDIITKGSEKIFPKEIESLLGTFPAIEEAYVVGVPDEHWGEELNGICEKLLRISSENPTVCISLNPMECRES